MSHLVKVRKVLGDMIYLTGPVKREAEEVVIWTEQNWYMKIVNSLYNMVSGRFNFKRNKRFDSLRWSLVVQYLYTRKVYIIG